MNLDASYAWCVGVARSQAKNFYYSFLLLSKPQREAMCAIYAFMRYCDDLSDADGIFENDADGVFQKDADGIFENDADGIFQKNAEGIVDRVAAIARWRADLESALAGRTPEHALWPAFIDSVARYKIPHQYFFDMIEGVTSDLIPRRVRTFDELYGYCYHVASVVGLTIIHIFGFDDPAALKLAEKCGIAFQLTNILRDVREDSQKQRVYLPAEDLDRFGVSPDTFHPASAFLRLMEFEAGRARDYYTESAPLVDLIHPSSRPSLRALIGIYSRLLDRIVASNYDVLSRRIRVPAWEKLWILAKVRFS